MQTSGKHLKPALNFQKSYAFITTVPYRSRKGYGLIARLAGATNHNTKAPTMKGLTVHSIDAECILLQRFRQGEEFSLPLSDVAFFRSDENYVRVYTKDGHYYQVLSTLSGVERKLPPHIFVRVHRCFIIGLAWIKTIRVVNRNEAARLSNAGGGGYVRLKNAYLGEEKLLPIGRKYRENLRTQPD